MSQDLEYIKSILKNCEEVESPFDIKKGNIVRYITINNGSEFFYDGGKYIKMLDNKVLIQDVNKIYKVPISIINREGDILYNTRFFIDCNCECDEKTKRYKYRVCSIWQ